MKENRAAQKFGRIVRQLRVERGWTQFDLAMELNADPAYVSRIECGTKNVSIETMVKLARVFGVKVSFGDKTL